MSQRCRMILIALGWAAAASAPAQERAAQVWRCGNSYSHQRCATGGAVDTRDTRSAEQRRQADLQTQRMRELGVQLHQENAAREAERRRQEIAQHRALARERALQAAAVRKAQAAERRHAAQRRKPSAARRVVAPQPAPATPSQ